MILKIITYRGQTFEYNSSFSNFRSKHLTLIVENSRARRDFISLYFAAIFPVRSRGSCRDISISPYDMDNSSLIFKALMSLLTVSLHLSHGSSSRALPLHLNLGDWSDVMCFVSSFHMLEPYLPSPSRDHRYRFRRGKSLHLLPVRKCIICKAWVD